MGTGYCHGCMERITTYPCPKCGYTPTYNASPYALQPGTILQGKYLVGSVLGQGGFGITYIGMDLQLQRKVAIKEYYPAGFVARKTGSSQVVWYSSDAAQEARSSGQELVLKEARKISKLSNIEPVVQVFNVFQENGTAYICMDFIDGHTLQHHLRHTGPLNWEQTKAIFLPILHTMDQIHKLGLIHRDLSPDNLMIQPNGLIKILDLGAAKDLNLNSGKSSMQVAKSGFSPLEQYMQCGNSGPWTDVYAMAATMYYTLTGQVPAVAIDRMDCDTMRWDLPQLQALPAPVLYALKHAMAVRSSERTQSMEDFVKELQGSIQQKRSSKKWRIPVIAAAAAVIAVAAIAIAVKTDPASTPKTPTGSTSSAGTSSKNLQKRIEQLISSSTREVYDYCNGTRMELYFNKQDQECLRIFINDAGQDEYIFMAEYDANGEIVELYGLEGDTLMRYITWTRNDNGKFTLKLECNGDGSLIEKTEVIYDKQGRETSRTRRDGDDFLLFESASTYDDTGSRTSKGLYNNGNRVVSNYNEDGKITDSITTGPDGKQESRSTYQYDASGKNTVYTSYDASDKLSYQTEYHYDGDLRIGATSRSIYEDTEYTYNYEYIFGPRNTKMGEHCRGDYNSKYEYVQDMLDNWQPLSFTLHEDNSIYINHTDWNQRHLYTEQFDESGNLIYYSEDLYDESGEEAGSKSIFYEANGEYDITVFDKDFNIVYSEYYDANGVLTEKSENQYDASGEKTGSISTQYNSDGSYTISERNAQYYPLVTRFYDDIGTLLSMEENSYDSSNKKTGSVLTTYYYDGSYTVTVKDAESKTVSEKTYDAQGNPIKSS